MKSKFTLVSRPLNLAYLATISGTLEAVLSPFGITTEDEVDDLGELQTRTLEIDGVVFELLRYRSVSKEQFDIHISPKQENWRELLKKITKELNIDEKEIAIINNEFMNWPG